MHARVALVLVAALSACGESPTSPPVSNDRDGDGVADALDAFPDDASESADSDGDGVGDNADVCPEFDDNGCAFGDCSSGSCECDTGWSGAACDECADGFYGAACSACTCAHGTCDDGSAGTGSCVCPPERTGAECDACTDGYFGSTCAACACVNGACDDGLAGDGSCSCDPGFAGAACDGCAAGHYGASCSACTCVNGVCDDGVAGDGSCSSCALGFAGSNCDACAVGYFGSSCSACTCVNGTCDDGMGGSGGCECALGSEGTSCDVCSAGYFGPTCAACTCVNGACDDGVSGAGSCTCVAGWDGADCDVCAGANPDPSTWYADGDDDGFGTPTGQLIDCLMPAGYADNAADCDDGDASINPGATEVCDGVDNDCAGPADESDAIDRSTWYRDSDGDGHGDVAVTQLACEQPTGFVANANDCDDTDAAVNPAATEICDGIDNDCAGPADESDAVDQTTWYFDSDGDSYGDGALSQDACVPPSDYVANADDCDDSDPAVHPDTDWYYDGDLDGYGDGDPFYTQCVDPGAYFVTLSGDCAPSDATSYPGAPEVCLSGCSAEGDDNDCDGTVDNGCPTIHGGTIAADEIWSGSDNHLVACNTYVQGSAAPTLTIEDGAQVEFAGNAGLWVGFSAPGGIDVQGTPLLGVTFDAVSGLPGSYPGLNVSAQSTTATLAGLTVRNAGGSSSYPGAVYIYNATVNITDAVIESSDRHGIYIHDSTVWIAGTRVANSTDNGVHCATATCLDPAPASFTNNLIEDNGGVPMRLLAPEVASLNASTTMRNNGDNRIDIAGGTVSASGSWPRIDGTPYLVSNNVYVQDNTAAPTLIIEDGVEIEFSAGRAVFVGYSYGGGIDIRGTTLGVLFTSGLATPAEGDWYGLNVGYYADASIDGVTIEFGGGSASYPGGLYVNSVTAARVSNSTLRSNARSGVYVGNNGAAQITSSTIGDNELYGVNMAAGARLDGSFANNTVTGNGSYPITLAAAQVAALANSSTFTGNTLDYVRVEGGTITTDATWQAHAGAPYHIGGSIYVQAPAGPVLTIADNAELLFNSGGGLFAGYSGNGDLIVAGDRSDGTATRLSAYGSTTPGAWYGVHVGFYSSASQLTGFDLEYAGSSSSYPAGLYLYYATVVLDDCLVTNNLRHGLYARAVDLTMTDCTISGTVANNLAVDGDGVRFVDANAVVSWARNTVTGNERYPVNLLPGHMAALDTVSSFAGNGIDRVLVQPGTVAASGTWPALDVAWYLAGDVDISGPAAPQITTDNAYYEFAAGAVLRVANGTYGDLIANNCTFTSASSSPAAGDWDGLYFGFYGSASAAVTNSNVLYAGGNASFPGSIYLYYTSATVTGNVIADSASYGINCSSGTAGATISGNLGVNNALGDMNGCPGF